MIQNKVNHAALNVDSIKVFNTREDEVTISINSWVEADDSISATIDGFEADMYLEDKLPHVPFATLQMPQTKTGLTIINVTQTIKTNSGESSQAFVDYNTWLLANETVRMGVSGRTTVRVKGLKGYGVDFKKVVELKGALTTLHVKSCIY